MGTERFSFFLKFSKENFVDRLKIYLNVAKMASTVYETDNCFGATIARRLKANRATVVRHGKAYRAK